MNLTPLPHRPQDACFVMVCIESATRKPTKVRPLVPATDAQKQSFHMGRLNQIARKKRAESSILQGDVLPSQDELRVVHKLMLRSKEEKEKDVQSLPMDSPLCRLESTSITQPQDRNQASSIFGGALISKSFEIARANAYIFCGPGCHASERLDRDKRVLHRSPCSFFT
jgi:acyl-CoA hydrolase